MCGVNATKAGHLTGTVKVEAGSTLGFVAIAATYNQGVIAPHPVGVHMYLSIQSLIDRSTTGDLMELATKGLAKCTCPWLPVLWKTMRVTVTGSRSPQAGHRTANIGTRMARLGSLQ